LLVALRLFLLLMLSIGSLELSISWNLPLLSGLALVVVRA